MGDPLEETPTETKTDVEELDSLAALFDTEAEVETPAAEVEEVVETPEEVKEPEGEPVESPDLSDEQVAAMPANEQGFYKGMKKERGKRQELETSVEAFKKEAADTKLLNQQLSELVKNFQQPAPGAVAPVVEEEKKGFWDAPEDYIANAMKAAAPQDDPTAATQILGMSLQLAKNRHDDFTDDVMGLAQQAIAADPALGKQVRLSSDPGEAAYTVGKRLQTMQMVKDAGGLDGYAEKIRAEERAKITTEGAELVAEETINEALPKSLGTSRAVSPGMKSATVNDGPDELSAYFPD